MKTLKLTQNQIVLIDDMDYEMLNQFKWCFALRGDKKTGYAVRRTSKEDGRKLIPMHRLIMNAPKGMEVDHINRNTLDNRRSNLRLVTRSENLMNRGLLKSNTSNVKGVSWHKHHQKWIVRIQAYRKPIFIGYFKDVENAKKAYAKAAKKYHGEFVGGNL